MGIGLEEVGIVEGDFGDGEFDILKLVGPLEESQFPLESHHSFDNVQEKDEDDGEARRNMKSSPAAERIHQSRS